MIIDYNSKYLKILLNINYYLYGLFFLFNIVKIFREVKNTQIDIKKHKMHFNYIQKKANDYFIQTQTF
jgi:hypothetical protein